jgi:transcriptional antiterminator NusG
MWGEAVTVGSGDLKPGQPVRIVDGPFNGFVGTVHKIYPDESKVRVTIDFFGRKTPVELNLMQVEKM